MKTRDEQKFQLLVTATMPWVSDIETGREPNPNEFVWTFDYCKQLVTKAGLLEEWNNASDSDPDDFLKVIMKACIIMRVECFM